MKPNLFKILDKIITCNLPSTVTPLEELKMKETLL